MRRIFLPSFEPSGQVSITGEKSRYLATVLRSQPGDEIIVVAPGSSHKTRIISMTKKEVIVETIAEIPLPEESPVDIILVQGLLKGEKMDMVVQKATELGVKAVIPAVTERSQVRETRKGTRWNKIAEEASRQCGRASAPKVFDPMDFERIFSSASDLIPAGNPVSGILLWEKEGLPVAEALKELQGRPSCVVAVGPEGGFSAQEVVTAEASGLIAASMGKRILRAETAAIAAVTLAQFVLGDMGHGLKDEGHR